MVLANEAAKILTDKYPNLKKHRSWDDSYILSYSDDDPLKIYAVMDALTNYVTDMLNMKLSKEIEKELKDIFSLTEFFINEGEDAVKGASSANFLENLINRTSWHTIRPESFIHYLGPKSKKFCKKWDEFTGVATPGLWEEGEFKGQKNPEDGWL